MFKLSITNKVGKLFPGKLLTVVKEHHFWYFEVFEAAKTKQNETKQNETKQNKTMK